MLAGCYRRGESRGPDGSGSVAARGLKGSTLPPLRRAPRLPPSQARWCQSGMDAGEEAGCNPRGAEPASNPRARQGKPEFPLLDLQWFRKRRGNQNIQHRAPCYRGLLGGRALSTGRGSNPRRRFLFCKAWINSPASAPGSIAVRHDQRIEWEHSGRNARSAHSVRIGVQQTQNQLLGGLS